VSATGAAPGPCAARRSPGSAPSARPTSSASATRPRRPDRSSSTGPILAVRVDDLGEKEAALEAHPGAFFTIQHFDGYPAVLVRLRTVSKKALREAVVDGWLAVAPDTLARSYVAKG
jgi:hypothetical protein